VGFDRQQRDKGAVGLDHERMGEKCGRYQKKP